MLLASTALDEIVPPDHVQRILERGADEALPELYRLCRDRPQFSLLLLSCFEPEAESPPDFPTHAGESRWDSGRERYAAGVGRASGPCWSLSLSDRSRREHRSLSAASICRARPITDQVREITASDCTAAPGWRADPRQSNATPRYKRSTGAGMVPQIPIPKLALFGAAALIVLGLVAWMTIPGRVKQDREARFTTLVTNAREANARAQATGDPGSKRQLLTTAQTDLVDAAKIHPDNGR